MSNEISFFWIPGLPICPVWKPFDDLKKKILDCYFTIGSIAEKSKQRPGIRLTS